MIEYKKGDILAEDAEALVNSVNCVGVMGKGIALQFKKAYPENFTAYVAACKHHQIQPDRLFVYETGALTNPRYIINFPTKRHWRSKSRLEDIKAGLNALSAEIEARQIRSIALPALGSGLGGLEWQKVRSLIEEILGKNESTRVIVFEPLPQSDLIEKDTRKAENSSMTASRAALIGLITRYLDGQLSPFISLLELHKLLYFLQESGKDLKLRFTQGYYGPYADNLRHVLRAMDGYYITGYGIDGDQPTKVIELLPGAAEEAQILLAENPSVQSRLERVSRLVEGFESPHGLELLATVHWLMTRSSALSDEEVLQGFYHWSPRKQQFSKSQILLAKKVLKELGWV